MPVDYADYPDNWLTEIRPRILARAGHRCECAGLCGLDHGGRCEEQHGAPAQWAAGQLGLLELVPDVPTVVLTIAHLDHDTTHNTDDNLAALCQRCHLRLDRAQHAQSRAQTRAEQEATTLPGQMPLLGAA